MKRKCKNIDITDVELIENCIQKCLHKKRKNRRDITQLKQKYKSVENLANAMRKEIIERKLEIKPIWYTEKVDPSSHKIRTIGIQDIKQQIYDYIAVEGLNEILKRIGTYQCASIKGRGQIYGISAVSRWIKDSSIRYAAKLDIRKCYESINQQKMMDFLRKHVKNDALLWLIEQLIGSFAQGLAIGSYLSQHLCNLYLSELYHEIGERMYKMRRGKRLNLVKHTCFYMDDILLLGTSANDMIKSVKLIIQKAGEMRLAIKPDWRVFKLSNNQFVDMMGAKIYRDHITIRKYVFKRIRRAFMHARQHMTVKLAFKCCSYWGLLKNTNSFKFRKKYKVQQILNKARREISHESKVRCTAARRVDKNVQR